MSMMCFCACREEGCYSLAIDIFLAHPICYNSYSLAYVSLSFVRQYNQKAFLTNLFSRMIYDM